MRFGATSAQTLAPLLAQCGREQLARFGAGLLQGATEEELAAMLAGRQGAHRAASSGV